MLMACSSWLWSVGMSPVLVVTSQFEQHLNIRFLCRLGTINLINSYEHHCSELSSFLYLCVCVILSHAAAFSSPLTAYRNMPDLVECLWGYIILNVSHYLLLVKLMFNLLVCDYCVGALA